MEWCTIESDPAVFTELIEKMGVKTPLETDEVVDMDSLESIEGCKGFILLFKYDKDTMAPTSRDAFVSSADPTVFFSKQTIENACGTLALLHVLLNADGVELGEQLSEFRSFAQAVGDARMIGDILGSSDGIRTAHNSFGRSEPFMADKSSSGAEGEAYHFVAYVPKNGALYELDGLQNGPIRLGAVPEPSAAAEASSTSSSSSSASASAAGAAATWVTAARESIRERIARYGTSGEIRFTLLSVQESRLHRAEEAQKRAGARFVVANTVLSNGGGATARAQALSCVSPTRLGAGWSPVTSSDGLTEQVAALQAEVDKSTARVKELRAQRAEWAAENARRKHNWVPFAMKLMLECAKAGKLSDMAEKGNERYKELVRQERTRRAAAAGAEAASHS